MGAAKISIPLLSLMLAACASSDVDTGDPNQDRGDTTASVDRQLCSESYGQWINSDFSSHCMCGFDAQFAPELGGCTKNSVLEAACMDSGGAVDSGSCNCGEMTLNGRGRCEDLGGNAGRPPAGANLELGAELYADNCVSCHGTYGAGDGPVGNVIDPAPRDFTAANYQYDANYNGTLGEFEDIRLVIAKGAAMYGGSVLMAPWPQFSGDPEKLDAITAYVMSLAR